MDYWQAGLNALRIEAAGLDRMIGDFESRLAPSFSAAIAQVLEAKGRTIISGMGKSGHIGRKFAATLSSTGTPAQFVHPAEASHGDLGAITASDVIFVISNSGGSDELSSIIAHASRFDIPLIAITARPDSALGRNATIILQVPDAQEACPNGLAPTTSTTLQLALCDALAVALLTARKFKPADFKIYHPGGKLGASIRTVASVMHSGAAFPLVSDKTPMRDAILEMTGKGLGIVAVTDVDGKLIGAITDGDLRRHITDPALLDKTAGHIMTRDPLTIEAEAWISQAAHEFEERRITSLFITDENRKPTGLVRLADLLRIGII